MSVNKQQDDPAAESLTAKQKKFLKGLAHPLKSVVLIGKEGLTTALVKATNQELKYHELIKVKIGSNSNIEKHATAATIANKTDSSMVQLIGKTIILYKPNPKISREKKVRPN